MDLSKTDRMEARGSLASDVYQSGCYSPIYIFLMSKVDAYVQLLVFDIAAAFPFIVHLSKSVHLIRFVKLLPLFL